MTLIKGGRHYFAVSSQFDFIDVVFISENEVMFGDWDFYFF